MSEPQGPALDAGDTDVIRRNPSRSGKPASSPIFQTRLRRWRGASGAIPDGTSFDLSGEDSTHQLVKCRGERASGPSGASTSATSMTIASSV